MNKKLHSIILWVISFILMLFLVFYQRMTGPSYPVKGSETINGTPVSYRFLRSSIAEQPLPVKISFKGNIDEAFLLSRVYKSGDDWLAQKMILSGNNFSADIKGMKSAAKIEYTVKVSVKGESRFLNDGKAIVARFRGDVPAVILIPHILLMFLAILFGARTGMEAIRKNGNYEWMVIATLIIVVIGGLVLGPIMQRYAFGKLWTGFPLGYDLTDNKTLLSILFWIAAFFLRKKSKYWVVAAALLMIAVYLIPHSVLGSELDPKTGILKTTL